MNQRADNIIPECYVDTNLIETLVCTAGCNHQKGCNQVAKVMKEKFTERFAVGIIDADKRRPGYLNEFTEIASSEHFKLFRHFKRPHFFIVVHPAIDGFILSCAKDGNLNMIDFGLSPDLNKFTAQTKSVMSNRDPRFKRLFKSMENVGEVKILEEILKYFLSTTYNASNEYILKIFNNVYPLI